MSSLITDKILLNSVQIDELFEEQKAVFNEVRANGEVFRPKADYFIAGQRVASLVYPSFKDDAEFESAFNKGAWFARMIFAEEILLYLDVTCELPKKGSVDTQESEVFIMLQANTDFLEFRAAPYYVEEGERYPTWDDTLKMSEEDVYAIKEIIFPLHFAISQKTHALNEEVVFQYLEANGFEIEFYHPMNRDTVRASRGLPIGI